MGCPGLPDQGCARASSLSARALAHLTSAHFVPIPREPIFVGLHGAALEGHAVAATTASAGGPELPQYPGIHITSRTFFS